jgi:hypothetical protein
MNSVCKRVIAGAVLCLAVVGNFAEPVAASGWEYLGLDSRVNVIRRVDNLLLVGTNGGIYSRPLDGSSGAWTFLGLADRNIRGLTAPDPDTIYAGVDNGEEPIYRSVDGGTNWQPHSGNWGGETFHPVFSIAHSPEDHDVLMATGLAVIGRSVNGGASWTTVWNDWEQMAMGVVFIEPDPYAASAWWAGGESAALFPWLLRSEDDGLNWEFEDVQLTGDNRCHDVCFDPNNSDNVYVSMEGQVQRRTGGIWEILLFNNYYLYAIEIDRLRPHILYTGGGQSQEPLALFKTADSGASWSTNAYPPATGVACLNMFLEAYPDSNVLYMATTDGVYRYVDTEASTCCRDGISGNVDMDPEGFRDISDILYLARYALLGGDTPLCMSSANTDGDPECFTDISDILRLARYSLLGGEPPAPCLPQCE